MSTRLVADLGGTNVRFALAAGNDGQLREMESLNCHNFAEFGDAIGSFKPIYGQGMTSAAMLAKALDETLNRQPSLQGAWSPFFSPDGQWVGYQKRGNEPKLMKLSIDGGTPVPLAESELPLGGSWGDDDRIVFSKGSGSPIWRVSIRSP